MTRPALGILSLRLVTRVSVGRPGHRSTSSCVHVQAVQTQAVCSRLWNSASEIQRRRLQLEGGRQTLVLEQIPSNDFLPINDAESLPFYPLVLKLVVCDSGREAANAITFGCYDQSIGAIAPRAPESLAPLATRALTHP